MQAIMTRFYRRNNMLQSLKIENYALIDSLEISFGKGFSTITGETGAGKSIILGALSLLVGQRADSSVMKNTDKKSIVEALFEISNYQLESLFSDNDIDYDTNTVIRREILNSGKSRAFVNDTPVTLDFLKELGEKLIDIHSQHQNIKLNTNEFQLSIVDGSAGLTPQINQYNNLFLLFKQKERELSELEQKVHIALQEHSYKAFLFDELEKEKLIDEEQSDLESELETLNHAEELHEHFSMTDLTFNENESNILSQLKNAITLLSKTTSIYKPSVALTNRLEEVYIELKDIASEIHEHSENIQSNPERQQIVNTRLQTIYNLQKKHKVQSVKELLEIKNLLADFLQKTANYDSEIEQIKVQIEEYKTELHIQSDKLIEKRKATASILAEKIRQKLQILGMPNAQFCIDVQKTKDLRLNGSTDITFLFSANKNSTLKPINETASGGELSRIMLCLKAEISEAKSLPTIIFDEIDTGVSGDIADKMGNIMQEMGNNMQVICITHLPQIASKGTEHYIVYKHDDSNTTQTNIKQLDKHERITEIAKMLSGKNLTNAAIQNAKELLNS